MRNYLTLFAGTFCICLFVVMMQFLWKYVDELIGKGLSFDVLAQFLFYSGLTLVPLALPLAILLASLISFGNMGERLELLSMKAAGISLWRTLRSLVVINTLLAGGSFYFQNTISPEAQMNLMQLLFSMRTKSPELDIPEGVFYDGIQGVNMYVKHKDKNTGILYDMTIYNMRDGVNNAHIILADSGKLQTTYDKKALLLTLYSGEQFENMNNSSLRTNNVPYRRETFVTKTFIIDFDMNLNMMDQSNFSSNERVMNMHQLDAFIDSMIVVGDSVGRVSYDEMLAGNLHISNTTMAKRRDFKTGKMERTVDEKDIVHVENDTLNIDSLFSRLDPARRQRICMSAMQKTSMLKMDTEFKSTYTNYVSTDIRWHQIAYWQKITMALSCLLFFFIGAPLGAIIRKGGLGMPVVVAVVIFIVYYMIDTGCMKTSREGSIPVWFGMWISSMIMTPLGMFLTIKSNNDSVVFNMDAYKNAINRLLGIRQKRNITLKEVIIDDPDYADMSKVLTQLIELCRDYKKDMARRHPIGYLIYICKFFLKDHEDMKAEGIYNIVEYAVDVLANSKDRKILIYLNYLPIMDTRSFRFYRRRNQDIKNIIKYSELIKNRINEKYQVQ